MSGASKQHAVYLDPTPPPAPPFAPTAPAMLHWLADRHETREAQVRGEQRMSFRDLERRSAKMALGLLALGIGKGSRVALLMPNGPDFTVAFMAATRIGAVAAPLSTLYQAPELAWVLRHGDFQLLMTCDRYRRHDYLDRLEAALPSLARAGAGALALPEAPHLRSILVWGEDGRPWSAPGPQTLAQAAEASALTEAALQTAEAEVTPADLIFTIFTSGSSARPKAVLHRHGAVLRHSWQKTQRYWAFGDGDRVIGPRPQFWIAGLAATLFQSLLGGCCLLEPEDLSGASVLRLIEDEAATGACGDASWLQGLGADPVLEAAGYTGFMQNLECVTFAAKDGAGARFLHPGRAQREPSPARVPMTRLARSYGMTETLSSHTSLPFGEYLPPDKPNHSGRPMPGVKMKIVDPVSREPVAIGEVGEVLIGGYSLMEGLYKRERSEVFTDDGYYATGDLASMDGEGYVLFNSRVGDMLKVSGANVAPLEVEQCLNAMPQIERSAVLGLPASDRDVLLVAAVQMRGTATFDEAAIIDDLRGQLSSFKVPKRIFALALEDLPLTGSNKIRKALLSEQLAEILRTSPRLTTKA